MKKCEVKAKMAETYASDGYPTEFPYRQRVVLLFQVSGWLRSCIHTWVAATHVHGEWVGG